MSHQQYPQRPGGWPPHQQPGPPVPPPPGWGQPHPQPPKKGSAGKVLGLGCAGFLAVCVFLGVLAFIFGGDRSSNSAAPEGSSKASASASPSTTPDVSAAWPDESAPFPPEPIAKDWDAYIDGLDAINPDIVHGKEEKAVDRGRDQCTTVREHPEDQDLLVEYTNKRFTSPTHPEGHGAATSAQILSLVRKYICPEV